MKQKSLNLFDLVTKIQKFHVTCKNPNCKSNGKHYNSDKIEEKLR